MPYAAPTESRFISPAVSGTTIERKAIRSSRKLSSDHGRDHERQLLADPVGEIDVAGGLAADVGRQRGPLDAPSGITGERSVLTRSSVASADGAVVGITVNDRGVARLVDRRRRDVLDALRLADLVLELDQPRVARRRSSGTASCCVGLLLLLGRRLRRDLLLGLGLRLVRRAPPRPRAAAVVCSTACCSCCCCCA